MCFLSVIRYHINTLKMASLAIFLLSSQRIIASDHVEEEKTKFAVSSFLKVGSHEVKMPALSMEKSVKGEVFGVADLLKFSFTDVSVFNPMEGADFKWGNSSVNWEKVTSAKNGFVYPERRVQKDKNLISFLAFYIQADRWMEAELRVSSPQLLEIYFNGSLHDSKISADKPDAEKTGSAKKTLKLERGKHLIVIKTLKTADDESDWMVKAELEFGKQYEKSIRTEISPKTVKNIHQLLEGEFVNSASISPDGQLALLRFSSVQPPAGKTERWAEVRDLTTGETVYSFRHADISQISWAPEGRAVTYRTSKDGKGSLWVFSLENFALRQLLNDVENLGSTAWSEDGNFIIFSISEKPDSEKSGLTKLEGMPDRWPWWRTRSFLYKLDVKSGIKERLTHGHIGADLQDIHPDGSKILFSQNIPDFSERPYSKQILVEMDLAFYQVDTIWENNVSGSVQYSPNGEYLLVVGSPTMFGNIGVNVANDLIPNESDGQVYIYNLSTGDVEAITFAFDPSIMQAYWSRFDENKIYFLTTDRTYRNIYVYDLNTRYFEKIESGLDVVNDLSLAKYQPFALITGSGVSTPPDVRKMDLALGQIQVIANPREEQFNHVAFGRTEEWNFVSNEGVAIEGRVYYPPDFDKTKKYPLLVYYYAGTTPTDRSFGGRYPKNMFAAQGYVVYNLQPSGATGYGQGFSAEHVNNWGITVADEIIQGTKLFVEEHSFIDTGKIGCIGASYGGFMTMLLLTRTDIFSAAISHAGISSISSYWGEGYWGYLYSSYASANSFPWNNKELYVGQSPLFSADKITTPLLLLHGADDTNVPVGESIQLYTALKLLGRPVELIKVEGQDHHILDYKKRILWQKTIFAWFDKWLKNQPEWWSELYPERNL
jgi:dipeptidyl aminopeptidase/acylaminoacyl peptidase